MISVRLQAHNRKTVTELLRRQGITPTHQRIEIAHALFTRREHLSADQILALVNSRYAEASKATVYNTLKLFLEKKLIRRGEWVVAMAGTTTRAGGTNLLRILQVGRPDVSPSLHTPRISRSPRTSKLT